MKIVNPLSFQNAIREVNEGRFGYLNNDSFEIPYSVTVPLAGFSLPDGFPNCCVGHRKLLARAQSIFDDFPSCCEPHKKLLAAEWFDRENYSGIPKKTVDTILHTEYHIQQQIDRVDWYKDITDYIEYCNASFGQFPEGYGPPLGFSLYYEAMIQFIATNDNINPEKKDKLGKFLVDVVNHEGEANLPDMNILIDAYRRWLKVFPFKISYFGVLKNNFEKQLPIFDGKPKYNPYLGTSKNKVVSLMTLINILNDRTKQLLNSVKSSELIQAGVIKDINKHTIDLLNEGHRIKQSSLLDSYTRGEMAYVNVLKKWLSNEKDYFKEFTKINQEVTASGSKTNTAETQEEKLKTEVRAYDFFDLNKIKSLSEQQVEKLMGLLLQNQLPYKIAMMHFLGFITHLETKYFRNSKYKMHKEISKWFNSDKEGRAVKGCISSLSPVTTENKNRYTAHIHIERVKTDYMALK